MTDWCCYCGLETPRDAVCDDCVRAWADALHDGRIEDCDHDERRGDSDEFVCLSCGFIGLSWGPDKADGPVPVSHAHADRLLDTYVLRQPDLVAGGA